jgi:NTE family protein
MLENVPSPVLILSGGVGLGAYQAGAFACHAERNVTPIWLAGSSIGAVNAAVIAGTATEDRVTQLKALWQNEQSFAATGARIPLPEPWRHAASWATAIGTRLVGAPGQFHPRLANPFGKFRSFYDLEPLRHFRFLYESVIAFG